MKCMDTYALMALAQGDPVFAKYFSEDFCVPDTTLAELYWVLLRDFSEATAQQWREKLAAYTAPVDDAMMIEAMRFRFRNKKKDYSFFDAVGYIFAQRKRCPFVTGDEAFRGMENVEFIKSATHH